MQTVHDLVRLAARRAPRQMALVDDRSARRLTYAELLQAIDRLAAGLTRSGIGAGDRVATCLPNLYDHALALLALDRLGAVPALINARLKPEDVGELIRQGTMRAAIVAADRAIIGAARSALPPGAPLLTVGGAVDGSADLGVCAEEAGPPPAYVRPTPEATAFVFYTSGTTGLPKGAEIPHRAAEARLLYMSTQCGMTHGMHNRVLGLMPLFHVVGFYSVLLGALGFDGTYYVSSSFDPAKAIETIERERITLVYGTPTHFHAILAAPNFAREKMASVETVVYAGAPMPGPLLDRVGQMFPGRITNIYGTTEVMNALYMPHPVGHPHTYRPGYYSQVRVGRFGGSVHDEAGPGEDGELLVDASADATFTRYLNRPDATAAKMQDGWYRTGDIAVRRDDGDFDLKGRVDDMIISGGENIYPEEVEAALLQHEGVRECSVVGAADQKWGEVVVACVVAKAPGLAQAELDRFLRASRLADYKRPRVYLFMDELPKNATNKVLRRVLREKAARAAEPMWST
jgi:acyl-CoA synthetase (AMP-forming)/AMP-acid ligase II